jgi:hypothetical protein
LALLDSRDHKLASWIERVKIGKHTLSLLLPAKARQRGHDKLRISGAGIKTRMLPVNILPT